MKHGELHHVHRVGWLRASVLGANDGIVSTASLVIGVAAAQASHGGVLTAGVAGLVAGAMSMAAGEYVSVSSQADSERADLERERRELASAPESELAELSGLWIERGLTPELARQVADALTAHDAIAAHARDELGISPTHRARPVQAAFFSAATFAVGSALPLVTVALAPAAAAVPAVAVASLLSLALLGAASARAGGAPVGRAVGRVILWGALAMLVTDGIGRAFGAAL